MIFYSAVTGSSSSRRKRSAGVVHRSFNLNVRRCYFRNCITPPDADVEPPPEDQPEDRVYWSDPASWEGTEEGWGGNYGVGVYGLPREGDDVKIKSGSLLFHVFQVVF